MPIDPKALEQLSRDALIAKAEELGARRPELLTRPELRDEIIRLTETDEAERRLARGWFGVARDLVASVVAQGLSLPDTADLIRGVNVKAPRSGPPVATVTLAEIYAAQGHVGKALTLLDEVLAKEPDHAAARAARDRFAPAVADAVPLIQPEPDDEAIESVQPVGTGAIEAVDEPPIAETTNEAPSAAIQQEPQQSEPLPTATTPDYADPKPAAEAALATSPVDTDFADEAEHTVRSGNAPREQRDGRAVFACDDDLLVLVYRDGQVPECVWQLGRARRNRRDLALRILDVEPAWEGPVSRESYIALDGVQGRVPVASVKGVLRVALGQWNGDQFKVFCVGGQVVFAEATGLKFTWSPPSRMNRATFEQICGDGLLRLFG